jgi:hypothetical protein
MRKVLTRLVWLGLILFGVQAFAYIPPASFLMDRLAKKRTQIGVRRLKVSLECKDEKGTPQAEVLYLKVHGLVRRERADGRVEICHKGKCWVKRGGEKPERLPSWAYLPYLYFVEEGSDGSRYLGLLKSQGVDTRVNTITRFYSRLAVVLGAKHWERDRPQFWLDKDLYLPLRFMVKEGESLMDILWIDWGSKTAGDWFPTTLEIRSDGKIIESCRVTDVKTGVSMPNDLFKL